MAGRLSASADREKVGEGNALPQSELGERYIQIGVTALRDPRTGEYLPAVPVYIRADAGSTEGQEALTQDIGRLFADRLKRYEAECEALAKARFVEGRSLPQPYPIGGR